MDSREHTYKLVPADAKVEISPVDLEKYPWQKMENLWKTHTTNDAKFTKQSDNGPVRCCQIMLKVSTFSHKIQHEVWRFYPTILRRWGWWRPVGMSLARNLIWLAANIALGILKEQSWIYCPIDLSKFDSFNSI